MVQIEDVTAPSPETPNAFTFRPLGPLPSLQAPRACELLTKWDLIQNIRSQAFRFDQPFSPPMLHAFLGDLLNSPAVQEVLPVCTGRGSWGSPGKVSGIHAERLRTTELRLYLFDRLADAGVTRTVGEEQHVCKCLDVQCGEILASDRLRLLLLDEGSEEWELYTEAERRELLFHLLRRLAIGGGMNQYEDTLEPYKDMCKAVYRDLLAVQKDNAGRLQVRSLALQVTRATTTAAPLWPRDGDNNFLYVSIDPLQRRVTMWYGAWFPMM